MELLAPAGSWNALIAAVANGADAIYLGGPGYNARQSAENFSRDQISRAVEFAHGRNRKIYITVNTLLRDQEIHSALDYVFELYQRDIDAVIVQDIGLLAAIRELLPDLRVHASTQMTVHNAQGVQLLHQQGVKRVVLARELSWQDIGLIRDCSEPELEVFVHGALCYSYSGQCLFSSMVGGRSGNRGRCAQPCRLPYTLNSHSGKQYETKGRYLLSPSDLSLIEYLPQLVEKGIDSLKIEGRMKRPEYVAIVTRAYRQALDLVASGGRTAQAGVLQEQMKRIFNRTFTPGYFDDRVLRRLSTQRPNNRGVYIGRVVSQDHQGYTRIHLHDELAVGDGVDIWVSRGKGPAFIVQHMEVDGQTVQSASSGQTVSLALNDRVSPHDRVFKTHDQKLMASAQSSIRDTGRQMIAVDVHVKLRAGRPMQVAYRTESGWEAAAQSASPAVPAQQNPLDQSVLEDKLGRLGNTLFRLHHLHLDSEGELIVPFSEINQMRRTAVEKLTRLVVAKHQRQVEASVFDRNKSQYLAARPRPVGSNSRLPELRVLISSVKAARAALQGGADTAYLALEGPGDRRRPRAGDIRQLIGEFEQSGKKVIPVMPRIHKPTDRFDYGKLALEAECSQVMAGDLGWIRWCQQNAMRFWTDYNLNVLNSHTVDQLIQWGAVGVCASPELTLTQLQSFPNLGELELVVYGELVLMVSETCVLYEVLEEQPRCSHWCRQDSFYLQDEKGYAFPVQGDADCRLSVFNSRTLSMLQDLPGLVKARPAGLRLELRRAELHQVEPIVSVFRSALDDIAADVKPDYEALRTCLEQNSRSAFTKGHYYRGVE